VNQALSCRESTKAPEASRPPTRDPPQAVAPGCALPVAWRASTLDGVSEIDCVEGFLEKASGVADLRPCTLGLRTHTRGRRTGGGAGGPARGAKAVREYHTYDHHVEGRPRTVALAQSVRRCFCDRDRVPTLVEGTLHQLPQGRIPLNCQHSETRHRRWQGAASYAESWRTGKWTWKTAPRTELLSRTMPLPWARTTRRTVASCQNPVLPPQVEEAGEPGVTVYVAASAFESIINYTSKG